MPCFLLRALPPDEELGGCNLNQQAASWWRAMLSCNGEETLLEVAVDLQ